MEHKTIGDNYERDYQIPIIGSYRTRGRGLSRGQGRRFYVRYRKDALIA